MNCYLIPTNDEQWAALISIDDSSVEPLVRCVECGRSDHIAYYINHREGCIAAAFIRQAIANLTPAQRAYREEMEAFL